MKLLSPSRFRFAVLATLASANILAADFAVGPRDNIVVLGDSITSEGSYAQYIQDLIDEAYPDRLMRVIARGVHGDTARGAYERTEIDVTRWRPDWVLLNFGINDVGRFSTEEFLVHYERLINRVLRPARQRPVLVSRLHIRHRHLIHERQRGRPRPGRRLGGVDCFRREAKRECARKMPPCHRGLNAPLRSLIRGAPASPPRGPPGAVRRLFP